MIIFYSIALIILCVIFVGYPLFCEILRPFHLPDIETNSSKEDNFNEQESLLASLSELEDEYLIGKVSKEDYQHQKIFLNRKYLEMKKEV